MKKIQKADAVVDISVLQHLPFLLYRKLRFHKAKKDYMSRRTPAARARRWTIRKRSPRYGEAVFLLYRKLRFRKEKKSCPAECKVAFFLCRMYVKSVSCLVFCIITPQIPY